jgi:hypothetical protein
MIATELKVWIWHMVLCKGLWYFGEYGALLEVSCWLTW